MQSYRDKTAKDLMSELWSISDRSHKDSDSFVFYFSGHGDLECIVGHDGEEVQIGEIPEMFVPENCSSLQHKPKVKIEKKTEIMCDTFYSTKYM